MQDRDTLISDNIHLVRYVVAKMHVQRPAHVEFEDLVSVGMIEMCKAADSYDPSKGASFRTWACEMIRWEVKRFLLSRTNRDVLHSLETDCVDTHSLELQAEISDMSRVLLKAVLRLDYKKQMIILRRFWANQSFIEIAGYVGLNSPQRVFYYYKMALKQLRTMLPEGYDEWY